MFINNNMGKNMNNATFTRLKKNLKYASEIMSFLKLDLIFGLENDISICGVKMMDHYNTTYERGFFTIITFPPNYLFFT